MASYEITCVNKINGIIISVGCYDGSQFTEQDVINKISNGDYFYTYDYVLRKVATVKIEKSARGRYFIKTAADCTVNNNLDNLPSC